MARLSNKDVLKAIAAMNITPKFETMAQDAFKEMIALVKEEKESITVTGYGKFVYRPGSKSRHPSVSFRPSKKVPTAVDEITTETPFDNILSECSRDAFFTKLGILKTERLAALYALMALKVAFVGDAPVAITNCGRFAVTERLVEKVAGKTIANPGVRYSYSHRLPLKG
ncbi:hypothetical protein CZP2022_131 [Vibrio phage C-ZP2022]|nr:hypothetical protein CZP2022_131 [Vibrio phage C-ZP2022]